MPFRKSVLVLERELQALRTELLQPPGPPLRPRSENVRVPPVVPDELVELAGTPCAQPSMDVHRVENSNKKMRLGTPQNQEEVQNLVSGISNDMLLIVLAQGQKEMEERPVVEQRRAAVSSEGGQEG